MPLVYVLLTNKMQETYKEVLKILVGFEKDINPTDVTIDFEMAAINAIRAVFPLTDVHGCHFHWSQNLWRHIQNIGLQTRYNENEDFALNIRLLLALAFVPEDSVMDAYEELTATEFFASGDEKIESLLDYFQMTYMYAFDRKGNKKEPLYSIKLWNVYETVLAGKCCLLFSYCSVSFIFKKLF